MGTAFKIGLFIGIVGIVISIIDLYNKAQREKRDEDRYNALLAEIRKSKGQ